MKKSQILNKSKIFSLNYVAGEPFPWSKLRSPDFAPQITRRVTEFTQIQLNIGQRILEGEPSDTYLEKRNHTLCQ